MKAIIVCKNFSGLLILMRIFLLLIFLQKNEHWRQQDKAYRSGDFQELPLHALHSGKYSDSDGGLLHLLLPPSRKSDPVRSVISTLFLYFLQLGRDSGLTSQEASFLISMIGNLPYH